MAHDFISAEYCPNHRTKRSHVHKSTPSPIHPNTWPLIPFQRHSFLLDTILGHNEYFQIITRVYISFRRPRECVLDQLRGLLHGHGRKWSVGHILFHHLHIQNTCKWNHEQEHDLECTNWGLFTFLFTTHTHRYQTEEVHDSLLYLIVQERLN